MSEQKDPKSPGDPTTVILGKQLKVEQLTAWATLSIFSLFWMKIQIHKQEQLQQLSSLTFSRFSLAAELQS